MCFSGHFEFEVYIKLKSVNIGFIKSVRMYFEAIHFNQTASLGQYGGHLEFPNKDND